MAEVDQNTGSGRMSVPERLQRIEESIEKLATQVRQLATARAVGEPMTATLHARVAEHGNAIDGLSEWRAEVRGSLKLGAWLAGGAGAALFAAICAVAGAMWADHDKNTAQQWRIEQLEADRTTLRNDLAALRALMSQRGP